MNNYGVEIKLATTILCERLQLENDMEGKSRTETQTVVDREVFRKLTTKWRGERSVFNVYKTAQREEQEMKYRITRYLCFSFPFVLDLILSSHHVLN